MELLASAAPPVPHYSRAGHHATNRWFLKARPAIRRRPTSLKTQPESASSVIKSLESRKLRFPTSNAQISRFGQEEPPESPAGRVQKDDRLLGGGGMASDPPPSTTGLGLAGFFFPLFQPIDDLAIGALN